MKLHHLILALMLTIGLYGCYSTNSRYSYDTRTDFSGLNSYAWMPLDQAAFSTPESTAHYKNTMDNMLATKGFTLNPEAPDFFIKTNHVETYVEKYETLSGQVDFPKAMLRVDFLNPSSKEVIYEGVSTAYLAENETQKSKNAIIDEAVENILKEFPPGK